ncbi:sensor histidine kinase [Nocardioides sp.]|uniref:sensor histidine kinase n=1 Tax=Nocardioides sp. TaxID=35761 RepID=UPI003515EB03
MESRRTPAPYQPRLRWYGHLWRDLLAGSFGVVVWLTLAPRQLESAPLLFAADIAVGVLALAVVHLRRRHPLATAVVLLALNPLSSLSTGFVALATVSLATHRRWWQIGIVAPLHLAATWAYERLQPTQGDPWWLTTALTLLIVSAMVAWGMFIGSRRELVHTLRQRAETAEAERDLRAAQARSTERARIAREMHDVLAHRISQISLYAGALSYREDLTADEVRASAGVIRAKAHEALEDLREVLGVLRAEQGAAVTPQPTLSDLPALLDSARATGSSIELLAPLPEDDALPEAVGRTVYRIVQEGITNAAKHAPAATVQLRITGSPDRGVVVEIRNRLGFGSGTPGAGLGLIGLAERAELRGGRLTHRVERVPASGGPGTFVLRAWLPWESAAGDPDLAHAAAVAP